MGRRKKRGYVRSNNGAMMDIMTASVGCLVLILVSVLLLALKAKVNLYLGDNWGTAEDPLPFTRYVTLGADFERYRREMGNRTMNPNYIDVHRDRLIFYPGEHSMQIMELKFPDNDLDRLIERILKNRAYRKQEYVVLLVRPGSAGTTQHIRQQLSRHGINVGYELFENEQVIDYEDVPAVSRKEGMRDVNY